VAQNQARITIYHTDKWSWEMVFANIRAVGVERTTMATDLGQKTNTPVTEGCVAFAQSLLDAGFTTVEINRTAATITHRLIS
jgi:hypothetical protein